MRRSASVAVGLDQAGAPGRTAGFCRFDGSARAELASLPTDEEILGRTLNAGPDVVSIDAPLSIPRGRRTVDDRSGPDLGACDRELLARRIRFFPITMGPMRMLTSRGLRLCKMLERHGLRLIESYPGGPQDVLGHPRKPDGEEALRRGLRRLGISGDITRLDLTPDELDAATCAVVGLEVLAGQSEALGDPTEGPRHLPRRRRVSASSRRREAPQ